MQRIVLVDDNLVSCHIVEEIIKETPYALVIFHNAKAAIDYLRMHEADLILLDILMPGMDGLQTCMFIKQLPNHAQTPIIFLTVKYEEQTIAQAYELGAVDYITKPFHRLELLARIRTHLLLAEQKAVLQEHNVKLQKLVETEIAKRQAQDALMVQRHKLMQLGEMAELVAHQWKQPLNAISLDVANMIIEDKLHAFDAVKNNDTTHLYEKTFKAFGDIERQVEHLKRTMYTFNQFYKPQKEGACFSVASAIEMTRLLMESSLHSHEIDFQSVLGEDFEISGDENSFVQVLLSLVNNAKDALKERMQENRTIVLTATVEAEDAVIVVEDNAGGIEASIMDQIFDQFVTTKSDEEGTGLGLYIAKMIVETQFGGTISVENTPQGARFSMRLQRC